MTYDKWSPVKNLSGKMIFDKTDKKYSYVIWFMNEWMNNKEKARN